MSDDSRALEVRRALANLRAELAAAGIDLADPRARQLVVAALGEGDRKMDAKTRAALAFEMRALTGRPYREIAEAVGYRSVGACHKAVQKLLDEALEVLGDAQETRASWLYRLERMWAGLQPKATSGDPVSVRAAVRVLAEVRQLVPNLQVARPEEQAGTGVVHVTFMLPEWDMSGDEEARRRAAIDVEARELPAPSG